MFASSMQPKQSRGRDVVVPDSTGMSYPPWMAGLNHQDQQDVCDPPVVFLKDCTSVYKLQGFCLKAPDSHQPPSNMKLLLAVCLTWALLHTAESLRCHTCSNDMCTNTTSVQCPATSTACQTITSVTGTGSSANVTVNKTCSTLQTCITPVNMATEWSINRGFIRSAHNQICCVSDNCNFQTLATPSTTENGKVCPACASAADSNAGTCNATLVCVGAEDSCFSGNTSTRCVDILQQGCLTRNLCSTPLILNALFGDNSDITCGAPWSVRMSSVLLALGLAAFKAFV